MILWGKYTLAAFFFCFAAVALSQPEQQYSDPLLLNGKIYVFHIPPGTEGHPFLAGREFSKGKLNLKGQEYNDVLLNYDIYNQQLLLKYNELTGASNPIILSDAWMEGFTIDNKDFKVFAFPGDSIKRFYQVISSGSYQVLYGFRKKLELSHFHGSSNRIFSGTIRTMYLMHEGRPTAYRSNKSFLKLFDRVSRNRIKDFLRKNRIKVKKSDDEHISSLVSFINTVAE